HHAERTRSGRERNPGSGSRDGAYDFWRHVDFHEAVPLGKRRKDPRISQTLGTCRAGAVLCHGRLEVVSNLTVGTPGPPLPWPSRSRNPSAGLKKLICSESPLASLGQGPCV